MMSILRPRNGVSVNFFDFDRLDMLAIADYDGIDCSLPGDNH